MKAFFENIHAEKAFKKRARAFLRAGDFNLDQEKSLFLELFYTTELDLMSLQNLSVKKARKLLSVYSLESHLSMATSIRLRNYLAENSGEYLFPSEFRSLSPADLQKLLLKNKEDLFVEDLKNVRVLCSKDEYTILPTPLRLNADPRYTGRGICIGFLDGGFYPHPDIMKPLRRVVAYKDLGSPWRPKSDFEKPDVHSWHGMQTCVSAVGNGYLSQGIYKGIASEASLALLKVRSERGFSTESIVAGIEWCIRKKKRYNIRILNISLGVDGDGSFRESAINHAAEEAVQAGICVVVAAGNEDWSRPTPPANSPSVITVGGLDDHNSLHPEEHGMYHSSFGVTADGIMKPEIIAPGIWVAAPTLPGTEFYRESEILWALAHCRDEKDYMSVLAETSNFTLPFAQTLSDLSAWKDKRAFLQNKLAEYKLISPYYQHVDGTSFSAPIVCSIIAQMLEANPDLNPRQVKNILMESAKRMDNVPVEKQGCGVVQAMEAVELARKRIYAPHFDYPQMRENGVLLRYEGEANNTVEVLGEFNSWKRGVHVMQKSAEGAWEKTIELDNPGTFAYKFLIDGQKWLDDPLNVNKVYDGFGGFNSQIMICGTRQTKEKLLVLEKNLSAIQSVKKETGKHRELLFEVDEVLGNECIGKNPFVKRLYEQRVRRVVDCLKNKKVENGINCYQLYNAGYIVQTPTLNIAFDVVSGQHVWDVYWDVDENLLDELAKCIDILFVSHRLADHLDLDIVNRLIQQDKLVVVPAGMENLCLNGVIGFEKGEKRNLYSLGRNEMSVYIESFKGIYRHETVSDLDLCIFKLSLHEKLNILYMPEHDFNRVEYYGKGGFLPHESGKIHLMLSPLPLWDEEGVFTKFKSYVDKINPDVFLPTHLSELGRNNFERRSGGYRRAFELLEKMGRDYEVLFWGDSVQIAYKE